MILPFMPTGSHVVLVNYQLGPGEQASDMAAAASRQALESAGLRADQLDCIIGASGSAEQAIPDGAVLLQQKLGAQGCSQTRHRDELLDRSGNTPCGGAEPRWYGYGYGA